MVDFTKQQKQTEKLMAAINAGMQLPGHKGNVGGAGAIGAGAAFMGMPNFAAPGAVSGGHGYYRIGNGGGGGGGGGGGTDPGTGGEDPGVTDPSKLGSLGKSFGFPKWYIDWYNSQGVYGGVPVQPVQGLL